jgi:hypothetical protein
MKAQISIDREIEIVETIIAQLKECLKIYYKRKLHKEIKITKRDLEKCKVELKRLNAKKYTD